MFWRTLQLLRYTPKSGFAVVARSRDVAPCEQFAELVTNPNGRGRVAEVLGANRHAARAGSDEVERVLPALDSAHANQRDPNALGNVVCHRERDRPHRRSGQPSLARAEERPAADGLEADSAERVYQR